MRILYTIARWFDYFYLLSNAIESRISILAVCCFSDRRKFSDPVSCTLAAGIKDHHRQDADDDAIDGEDIQGVAF